MIIAIDIIIVIMIMVMVMIMIIVVIIVFIIVYYRLLLFVVVCGSKASRKVFPGVGGPADERGDCQDSSKGDAVETGCSALHYIIGCFAI